jgi:phosphoglycolate phosphatase
VAAIIFDFDGTIADSFDYVAGFLAEQAGKSALTGRQKQSLRGRSMIAMARQLGHRWWRLPGLFIKGRQQMAAGIEHVKPFPGIPEVLRKLHAEGHELFIVSSNTVANIHAFLHHHNLHEYFLEVYGGVGLLSKAPALRRLLREQQLEKENTLYIGDETRDVKAAQQINLKVIGVTWGFASSRDLKSLHPTAVIDGTEELLETLEVV